MVYRRSLGSRPATVWLKYLAQAADTFRILRAERPNAVFVMSPPVFAVITVWLWSRLHRVPYVVDAHTAAFLHPRWRYFQSLHNALCRRAATTIVTNEYLGRVHLVLDSLTRNRSDAALIRVSVPFDDDPAAATRIGLDFLKSAYPALSRFLPYDIATSRS